jgi:hypothetical protein
MLLLCAGAGTVFFFRRPGQLSFGFIENMPLQFSKRSVTKNHLIGNLSLQFNHMPKLSIAIQSDIGNLPLQFGVILEICHSISTSG